MKIRYSSLVGPNTHIMGLGIALITTDEGRTIDITFLTYSIRFYFGV